MANKLDYSPQLSAPFSINPQRVDLSPAIASVKQIGQMQRASVSQVGEMQAKAQAMDVGKNATLFEMAKGAAEGFLDYQIKDVIDNTEYARKEKAKQEYRAAEQEVRLNAEGIAGYDGSEAMKAELDAKAKAIGDAAMQGALSKEEAIMRIASLVKDFSAVAPGWASDFRKIGAARTGISAIDTLGIHTWLTQDSAEKKRQDEIAKIQLRQAETIANWKGKDITALTPQDYADYHMFQTRKAQVDAAKMQMDANDMDSKSYAQAYGKGLVAAAGVQLAGVQQMLGDVSKGWVAGNTPEAAVANNKQRLALKDHLESVRQNLYEHARNTATNKYGVSIPEGRLKSALAEIDAQINPIISALNDPEKAQSLIEHMLRQTKAGAELDIQSFKFNNKFANRLNEFGPGMRTYFESYVTMTKDEFIAATGSEPLYYALNKLFRDGKVEHTVEMIDGVKRGQYSAASFGELPELQRNVAMYTILQELSTGKLSPEHFYNAAKAVFPHMTAYSMTQGSGNKQHMDKFGDFVDSMLKPDAPFMQQFMSLPVGKRREIAVPFLNEHAKVFQRTDAELKSRFEETKKLIKKQMDREVDYGDVDTPVNTAIGGWENAVIEYKPELERYTVSIPGHPLYGDGGLESSEDIAGVNFADTIKMYGRGPTAAGKVIGWIEKFKQAGL